MLTKIDLATLESVTGGASGPTATQQAQFRQLARDYCPQTYARYRSAPQITRRMGERCLDEAGLGMFRGQLDKYFPRQ
jgi:hypothetical protein